MSLIPARCCSLLALALLLGCRGLSVARAEGDWAAVQAAEEDDAKISAARELCQDETSSVADHVAGVLGVYAGSDAEAYLEVAVAKTRPNGMPWLAQRVYGTALNEAFGDLFDPEVSVPPRLDWGVLTDALMIGPVGNPEADRWLALMAIAEDGDTTGRVRAALQNNPDVRSRVREALNRVDVPRLIPAATLIAFGPPQNDAEIPWLRGRYQAAFLHSIEDRHIDDNAEFDSLKEAWSTAFPKQPVPLPPRDREIMRVLKPLLAPDDAPDVPPTFPEISAFMGRHNRTGWIRLIQLYAEGEALPVDALAFVCRASASECSEVLASGYVKDIASASDVAPALDLADGDATLSLACSQLPPAEAKQLAGRAAGAAMPLRMREAAAGCLMSLGEEMTGTWRQLLPEALRDGHWADAEIIAAVAGEVVDDDARSGVLAAVRRGEVRAVEVPWLLVGSDEGAALVHDAVIEADPSAFDGVPPNMARAVLPAIAEHVRTPAGRRLISLEPIDIE